MLCLNRRFTDMEEIKDAESWIEFIGGQNNVINLYDKQDCIYVYIKDASLVNLQKLKDSFGFESIELNGSRLKLLKKKETII